MAFHSRVRAGRNRNAVVVEQFFVSGPNLFSLYHGGHALPWQHRKLLRGKEVRAFCLPVATHNRLSQWVFGKLLGRGGEGIERGVVQGRNAFHRHDGGHAIGQRAGLVEGDAGYPCKPFQRVAFAHEEAALGGVANGGHDGRWRGEHQRAGAEYHQNGHGANDLSCGQPRDQGGAQGDDHDPGGPTIRQIDDLRLARVCRLHQTDHALDGTIFAHFGGAHFKSAELVDGAAGNAVANGFVHWQGFARHNRLIDGSLSGENHSIHGHRFPRQHADAVADLHLFGGQNGFAFTGQHSGGLRRKMHQLFNPCARPGYGQIL